MVSDREDAEVYGVREVNLEDIAKPYHTFALVRQDAEPRVMWCQFERWREDIRGFEFHVIHGGYFGIMDGDVVLLAEQDGFGPIDARLAWIGVIPREMQCDTGRIAKWIEEQISNG